MKKAGYIKQYRRNPAERSSRRKIQKYLNILRDSLEKELI